MTHSNFDDRAATWDDDPDKVARADAVAIAVGEAVPLDATTRLLEYGAGTGLVSQALRERVGPITLVDISAGMRDVMEKKVATGVLPNARVWDTDLAQAPIPDERFDLIVTVLVLHHIAETDAVLANFAAMCEPGGYVCIADLDAEDGSFHGEGFEGHHGFDREDLADRLRTAGFTDVTINDCYQVERDSGTFPLFLATARRDK